MCPQSIPTTIIETKNKNASTGPRTPEGKAVSSQNALKHGLASDTMIIAGESATEWEEFRDGMFAEWQPTTPTEEALVGDMAKHQWLKDRAIRLQNEKMSASGLQDNNLKHFSVLMRYQVTNERAFGHAKKQLEDLRKHRQREFVSQTEKDERERNAAVARVDAMSDEEVVQEMDKLILQFGLGPTPTQMRAAIEAEKGNFGG